ERPSRRGCCRIGAWRHDGRRAHRSNGPIRAAHPVAGPVPRARTLDGVRRSARSNRRSAPQRAIVFVDFHATSGRDRRYFVAGTPLSAQVNLLTLGTFDTPQQLFSTDNFSRSVAYLALGAPVREHADWTVRASLTQGDIASWIVAGEYTTRAPARHRYDLGWSYSMQRYDGGNIAALRSVTDGSRNAGVLYGFDTYSITPMLAVTYGGRYARYDYLDDRG